MCIPASLTTKKKPVFPRGKIWLSLAFATLFGGASYAQNAPGSPANDIDEARGGTLVQNAPSGSARASRECSGPSASLPSKCFSNPASRDLNPNLDGTRSNVNNAAPNPSLGNMDNAPGMTGTVTRGSAGTINSIDNGRSNVTTSPGMTGNYPSGGTGNYPAGGTGNYPSGGTGTGAGVRGGSAGASSGASGGAAGSSGGR